MKEVVNVEEINILCIVLRLTMNQGNLRISFDKIYLSKSKWRTLLGLRFSPMGILVFLPS